MKNENTQPYFIEGKMYQVYKMGKEPMNKKDDEQSNGNYKAWFEGAEKQLAKALLQMAKDRQTINGLNSACMTLEKSTRETMVKLHEAVVIIKEMSDSTMMRGKRPCQARELQRCLCESCIRDRSVKFVAEVGIELPEWQ